MDLACGDHRGNTAMKAAVNPTYLVLPGSPVAGDGMHVTVYQARRHGCSISVNDLSCFRCVDIFQFADGDNLSAISYDCVGVENWAGEVSAQHQADIADNKAAGSRGRLCLIMRHVVPSE